MMHEITLQIVPEAAGELRRHVITSAEADEIRGVLEKLDLELRELNPDTDDVLLSCFFRVVISEATEPTIDAILGHLRDCSAVDAAYIEPPDEPP